MRTNARRPGLVVAASLCVALIGCAQTREARPGERTPRVPAGALTGSGEAPAQSSRDLASAPTLARLLQLALERSPAIAVARERAAAAAEGAAIEGWLPDPQLMVGWYETSVETRVGPQEWSLSLRQPIPFPTKLDTKADIQNSEAERLRIAYERAARDVLVEVVKVAHEIAYIDEANRVTADIGALLERYATEAAAQETSSLVSELFRAETQRAQLENDRVILTELRAVEAQRMRSLLNLPVTTPLGTPTLGPAPEVRSSVAELLAVAERHNQELREAGVALETARLRSSLADQRHLPDLSLGITSVRTDELDRSLGMDPDGNGDDPLILQLGVTLPIWVQRDAAAIRRARSLERAASMARIETIQRTRDRVARAWFHAGNAQRLRRLYEDVLVPRAAIAARTAEDLRDAGKGTLGGVLETIAVFHNFRLAGARARADHGRAIADLERAIGQPFALVEAPRGADEEDRE